MKFTEAKSENWLAPPAYRPLTARQWVSAGNVWTVQLDLVMFGVRCNVCRVDDWQSVFRSYCCGENPLANVLLPRVVMKAMENLPDDAGETAAAAVLPDQVRKPMHNDPACWAALCRNAGIPFVGLSHYRDAQMPVTLADIFFENARAR